MNYIHQINFSTSELSFEEDLKRKQRKKKPRALLIHGFGGTGLYFYRMIDLLRHEFRITTIDMLGMGASGRPPFNLKTSRDSIEYFIHSIEAWVRSQKIKEKFVIIAHSYGGYISSEFSLRYPNRVSKLILLSPAGIPDQPKNQPSIQEMIEQEPTRKGKLMVKIQGKMVDKNVSPISILRTVGKKGRDKIITSWMRNWTTLTDH